MVTTIIVISVLLVLAILFLLIRIQTLVSVMKGTYSKRVDSSNKIHAFLFIVFLILGSIAFFWSATSASEYYLPEASSEHGVRTDTLFWLTMGILVFAFIVTNIFLFVFAYRYQYKEGNKAYFYPENHTLELVWTVVPAIVMSILVFYGWKEWSSITKPEPDNSEVIEVFAQQFSWQVRYTGPDGKLGDHNFKLIDATNTLGIDFNDKAAMDDFTAPVLRVPKGKPVLLRIRARDVIHSVFLPHFRIKMDAVPGMPTKFWFTPTKTTKEMREELGNANFNYEMACAEICGRGHFAMRFVVVVEEPEEFEAWKSEQKPISKINAEYVDEFLAGNSGDTKLTPVERTKEIEAIEIAVPNDSTEEEALIDTDSSANSN
jgi:cytochrome c oxidase subunit 2